MDKPGTRSSKTFYRKIDALMAQGKIRRVQRSVYESDSLEAAKELGELGREYGYRVRIYRVGLVGS
jgi:CRISPR/Cas system-associated endoribonuclease Cas2